MLPFLALGILCGQQGPRAQSALPVFWIALMVGAAIALWVPSMPAPDLINILSALILGALIAAAFPLPVPIYLGLALVFGLSHGYANGTAIAPPIKPYLFIPGVGLAGLVVTGYGVIMTDYLLRRKVGWMTIAVRVAGELDRGHRACRRSRELEAAAGLAREKRHHTHRSSLPNDPDRGSAKDAEEKRPQTKTAETSPRPFVTSSSLFSVPSVFSVARRYAVNLEAGPARRPARLQPPARTSVRREPWPPPAI